MARRDLTGAVDFSVLESYTGGDLAAGEEVLGLFRQQADLWLPLLDPLREGWRDAAHTVKGAAAGIGALELSHACSVAEAAPAEIAAAAISRVKDALDRALADVAAYQHELALQSLRSRV
jgi:HPt (histidine-containing phosphotransfer) domain-containing protein